MTSNANLRHGRRRRVVGCVAVVLAGLGPPSSAAAAQPQPTLSVSGSIDGLYPGFTGQLTIRVSNPFDRSIRLTTLTTTAAPMPIGCEPHLFIGQLSGQPVVPALSAIDIELPVSFDRAAPDTCQAVSMPLMFSINAAEVIDPPGAVIPYSGSNSASLIKVATLAVTLGAGAVLLARRRQR